MKDNKITIRAFVLGVVICIVFAIATVYFGNIRSTLMTSTQIPVLPYVLLFLTVLLLNPLCKLIRFVRPFTAAEILVIFMMGVVSAGISTFGLSAQVVPLASGLFNQSWNNQQTKWNQHIEPFINDEFFVAEDGIQDAAMAYRTALDAAATVRSVYAAALALTQEQKRLEQSRDALDLVENGDGTDADRAMAASRAKVILVAAQKVHDNAEAAWLDVRPDETTTPENVAETFPAIVRVKDAAAEEAQAALSVLEDKAFAKVNTLRRGLPSHLRAFPGFIPTTEDDFRSYFARARRFAGGMKSLDKLEEARIAIATGSTDDAGALMDDAIVRLGTIADLASLIEEKNEIDDILMTCRQRTSEVSKELEDLYSQARTAAKESKKEITGRIDDLSTEEEVLLRQQKDLEKDLEKAGFELDMAGRIDAASAGITQLRARIVTMSADEADARLGDIIDDYRFFDASARRFWVGDVPWSHWMKPMFRWGGLVVLTYLVMMTFNVLIFRQWAHNEKLIYPLAELPEHLAGAADDDTGLPYVFRNGLFWVGFAISASFLGWNLLCKTGVVPGLQAIDLQNLWAGFITETKLEGLKPRARSEIFFTMIGLSFLIPKKISFSLWFFSIVAMLQLLILVWTGHGVNANSFPADWCYTLNFRTAEGGGALLVFSAVVLFKCRKYILCFFNSSAIADLDADEQTELRISSFLFITGSIGIFLMLWKGMGADPFHTIFFMVVILLITVGLIRAVTEGGILGFQAWSGPFHFIRSFTGMNQAWTAPPLFAPLMVYYGVLFFDIKTFIAPAMANALKIRSDLKMKRARFHFAIFLAIVVSAVVAVLAEIMMSYSIGADLMQGWFHTGLPKMLYGKMASMSQNPPIASVSDTWWAGGGALAMGALLYARQFLFWMPHPIGMIMLVNPIMAAYWFSIFLGWLAKSMVTKYGNKELYANVRCLFFGLIVGELIIVALAMVFSYVLDVNIPIDLNRNG